MSTFQEQISSSIVLRERASRELLRENQPRREGRAGKPSPRLRAFRPDIEGLRALAVLAVVAYHALVPGITGGFVGVDIFLVISGFLITSHLLRELRTAGHISLPRFYARRIRRLLPAATLVVVVTVIAGWLILDPLQARNLTTDAIYSAGYAVNWHLASEGTNYLTATQAPSALQHYWSLAVEEQYYLVWPVLLVAAAFGLRRLGLLGADGHQGRSRALTVTVSVLLAAIVSASFLACVHLTRTAEPWAYFGLHTRAWELGVGALVAVFAPQFSRMRLSMASAATWVGLATIVGAILTFNDATVFPGAAAAVPTLGAALVIAGGCARPRSGAEILLGRAPLQVIGGLSYGWYLWHWPMLQLVPVALGHPLDLRHRLLTCFAALVLAAVSYALLEHPVRRMSWPDRLPWRGVGFGLALTALTAAFAVVTLNATPVPTGNGTAEQLAALSASSRLSAIIADDIAAGVNIKAVPSNLTPSLAAANTTLPQPQTDGCHAAFETTKVRTTCVYGDVSATKTIVLFGDSHALQWFPAMDSIAKTEHYRLVNVTKSSCTPFDVTIWSETLKRAYSECNTWRANAVTAIQSLHPSLVVMSSLTGVLDHGLDGGGAKFDAAWAKGTAATVSSLQSSTTKVAVIDDTLNPGKTVPQCLSGHLSNAKACVYYKAGGLYPQARRSVQSKAATAAGANDIDPTRWLCTNKACPTIVGNLLVFRDNQHLSTAYANWLAAPLGQRLGL